MTINKDTLVMLIELSEKKKSQYKGYYWTATWYEPETKEYFKTDIGTEFKNYKNWLSILNDPQPLGVYDGLFITKKTNKQLEPIKIDGYRILDGDSKPSKLHRFTEEEIQNIYFKYDLNRPKNNYLQLFASSQA